VSIIGRFVLIKNGWGRKPYRGPGIVVDVAPKKYAIDTPNGLMLYKPNDFRLLDPGSERDAARIAAFILMYPEIASNPALLSVPRD
jgi:hypothetical protein